MDSLLGGAVPPSLEPVSLQFIEEAGFCKVQAEDRTTQFIQVIEAELQRAEAIKDEFAEVSEFTTRMQNLQHIM